ncbi:hypothetical protein WJX73_003879 [Symbiochloris irregularis]|uniref:RRM domain-containing protein n=1 Tax=Symbiochloris irregularis TaxID=706552 RepID=A0AAW1NVP7_9CHLO
MQSGQEGTAVANPRSNAQASRPKRAPPNWKAMRKLFVTDLPLRTPDMLVSSLRAAFKPFGLVRVKLAGVDITKSYQQGPGLVTVSKKFPKQRKT